MLSKYIKLSSTLLRVSGRSFAATAAAPEKPLAEDPQIRGEQNIFKGQHVRYIPKKRLAFDFDSPEGPLALVYEASD